jgi:hypothetical protein
VGASHERYADVSERTCGRSTSAATVHPELFG